MKRPEPVDEEYHFEGRAIVSETDLHGKITFANRKFCEISGYTATELIGEPHSIVRHPDMPRAAFEEMWRTIQSGQTWSGLVKNLRKDGLYYWVDTQITPEFNHNHEITGYIAARKPANRQDIEEVKATYKSMIEDEQQG